MRTHSRGFTLIEIMIVVGVIGILAGIALPAYTGYMTRTRLSDGITAALPVKVALAEPLESVAALANAAAVSNGRSHSSKYVRSVLVTPATGMITITFEDANIPGINATSNTLTLTPYVNTAGAPVQLGTAVATGSEGGLLWGCASATAGAANAHGTTPLVMGTVPAKYAPAECR